MPTPGDGQYTGVKTLPNSIGQATTYLKDILDQIYAQTAKTGGLTPNPSIVKGMGEGASIQLATIETTGLGDYKPRQGYPMGDAKNTWVQYSLTHDRGISFIADSKETIQSGGIATATAFFAEAMRSHIVPEIDATAMMAIYKQVKANASATNVVDEAAALTAANVLTKIQKGLDTISDETGVDEGMTIYLNNNLKGVIHGSTEMTKTRDVTRKMGFDSRISEIDGNQIIWMPSKRMYSDITYNDGYTNAYSDTTTTPETVDWTKFGYDKASATGYNLNFVITSPNTAMNVKAINDPKYIPKAQSEQYDADQYKIRIWYDTILPKNKCKGCYVSRANI